MADHMLAEALAKKGIRDARVLAAIAHLDRSAFIPEPSRGAATRDVPLEIGHGQTISQPYIVALMSQALGLQGSERVLEIGTGSGYQTAVLAQLCREVYSVEIVPALARSASTLLKELGFQNVFLREVDGAQGWPEAAPFDVIIGTAAPEAVPPRLLAQLKLGGVMVMPIGPQGGAQELLRITRSAEGALPRVEHLLPVRFVPMTGEAQSPG
ncbi:protein-L-isoaspartate(D-aspartate) O-methyltransferase [Stigmatella aurantiaca]|uniref:Protein-L-isoaspartate O-methyltransferase n=1 Tax=Stigmatella aurantiaca (strain DW4/3-1) TaxID=378806 RepID=Q08WF1_STIAD|nr:protein-L-isoaspartate(D-aspartate) O-methyltransferase [Stigmatella aurantiaca]ADO71732.1 Protein-L-isoaspartate O-methyltransferase [Stigmatella aurantiaca DW4/3-1]EAU64822.1 protein-L-isoaspartate O-methyltransferase [Stigmatella aurantiaca DW4/3-1]